MARQWTVIQALLTARTGKTVGELHQMLELSCDKRSVYRDIQDLEAAGFPLCCETINGAQYWSVMEHARNPLAVPFKVEELIALYLSRDRVSDLKGTSIYKELNSLFTKIKAGIHESFYDYLEQSGPVPMLSFKHSYGQLDANAQVVVNQLEGAIQSKRFVDMAYYTMSRKAETQRRVAPYTLWLSEGEIYMIGYCELRLEVRIFNVKRIHQLIVLPETYTIPDDFNLDEFMEASFGIYQGVETQVKIRFDSEVANLIKERVWHPSQRITEFEDGSIHYELTVAGTEEIRRWVMGWGDHATVLAPVGLRHEICQMAQKMARDYGQLG